MIENGPWYTFPIGDAGLGYWLIGKNPHDPDKWYLMMVSHRRDLVGQYGSPHEAAFAVGQFKTGNPAWDSLRELYGWDVQRTDLDVLKAWIRHDEYPRPTEPGDEDEEDEEDDPN